MNEISSISQSANLTYRHCSRLLDLGLKPADIELISLDKLFESKLPRRKYRLYNLYKSIYRNKLMANRHLKEERTKIKESFYRDWIELKLPFSEGMIDSAWEYISKQVLCYDME